MAEDDPLLSVAVDVDIDHHLTIYDEVSIATRRSLCCRQLQLLEFPDKFVFRSSDPQFPNHGFLISRPGGDIRPLSGDCNYLSSSKVSIVYGIAGIIKLLAGTFVLLITSHKEVGTFGDFSVYLVKSMRFLRCNEGLQRSTSQEKRDEAYFLSLLRTIESIPGLYYSYERDLTLNLQITCKMTKERIHKPLWKQADPRFVWNHNLLEELIENKLDSFAIPLIQGSFQTIEFTIKDLHAKLTLISRRCNRRLGTRMWRRGANLGGSTANFIETEQLLECKGFRSSFLQIRGSIPLLWEQIVDLSYKPRVNIITHDETPRVVERHFHDVTQRYGNTMAINLTDKHGDEGWLSNAYATEMKKLRHIRYVSFDFHISCKNGNFGNLELLYDQVKDDFEDQG